MPHPGLRGRIAASLVLTAAVALVVAAITLLSPLERKLRTQEVRDLVTAAVQSRPAFSGIEPDSKAELQALLRARVRRVASVTGARVALLDSSRHVVVNTDPDARDAFRDAAPASKTDRAVRRIVGGDSAPQARVAVRVEAAGHPYVLALRKPLTEQHSAVLEVRRAFTTAAVVALAVALLLAGFFAATVGRRLRALRDAVLGFRLGAGPATIPHDRAHDEVGDLSRAFSEMADRLEREEAVRREFVATASHELRTPLTTLQGRLEILADELSGTAPDMAEGRRQLADARAQADRLGQLASDLLDLSRLDADVELRRERLDLHELARAVASEFRPRIEEEGRHFVLDGRLASAEGDPSACARIVRVLLDNALRYSPPGSPIELSIANGGGRVDLAVCDHGPGIPAADRERVFARFARGAGTAPGGGFGLGLAITSELAQRMDGELRLADSNGAGSRFVLELPAAAPNAIPTQASRR